MDPVADAAVCASSQRASACTLADGHDKSVFDFFVSPLLGDFLLKESACGFAGDME
jgi:hypothetical protein